MQLRSRTISFRKIALTLTLPALAAAGALTLTPGVRQQASAAPSISSLRAQVQQIQAEVAAIDEQVGQAAEAYNGAVYQLGLVNNRIAENRAGIQRATRKLGLVQTTLAERLRAEYMRPRPTPLQVYLTSGSASAAASASEALQRSALADAQMLRTVRALKAERITRAKELKKDREQAKAEVADRAAKRQAVESLLARRQTVLSSAKGALARELAAEAEREAARRREANRRAQALLANRNTGGSSTPAPSSGGSGGGSTPAPTVSAGSSARNAQAARVAMRYLGVPYVWGGGSPSGFDCSGLAQYAYAQVGVSMAHYTVAIYNAFPKVSYSNLQPGDLVFFSGLGHMGIYIGGGQMVHAPHTGDVVRVAPIAGRSFVGAVRP